MLLLKIQQLFFSNHKRWSKSIDTETYVIVAAGRTNSVGQINYQSATNQLPWCDERSRKLFLLASLKEGNIVKPYIYTEEASLREKKMMWWKFNPASRFSESGIVQAGDDLALTHMIVASSTDHRQLLHFLYHLPRNIKRWVKSDWKVLLIKLTLIFFPRETKWLWLQTSHLIPT